jgi:hypothetical protein
MDLCSVCFVVKCFLKIDFDIFFVFGGSKNNSQPENDFCLIKMLSKFRKMIYGF